MASKSKIRWTDWTWNFVTGCDKVSDGCDHCYAETFSERLRGTVAFPNGFDLTLKPDVLQKPLHWRKPRLVFVNSMSDLFHKDVPDDMLILAFDIMLEADQHIYQILTKRPHRMLHKIQALNLQMAEHIWLGVSVENQQFANNRIPPLLECQPGLAFLSCEPLLKPVDISEWVNQLGWVIVGGESGDDRRLMDVNWARGIRNTCFGADVPMFYKQGNARHPDKDRELDGREWNNFPQMVYDRGLREPDDGRVGRQMAMLGV